MRVNLDQSRAANPDQSVWVAANAGTGKTKVLTDRVLRLLLAGADPAHILCITYTKAAAAEMQNRIQKTLAQWVALSDEALRERLAMLLHPAKPDAATERLARQLFARVLDAPDGMRIQTFHSFCMSLLRRFPLEAGIHPHAQQMDDRSAKLLVQEAKQRIFARASEPGTQLHAAFAYLLTEKSEFGLGDLLQKMIGARRKLEANSPGGIDALIERMYSELKVQKNASEADLFAQHFTYYPPQEIGLRKAINILESGTKTDKESSEALAEWWSAHPEDRARFYESYRGVFLKADGNKLVSLCTKKPRESWDGLEQVLADEQERVLQFDQARRAKFHADLMQALLIVTDELLREYSRLKENHQALDYDDLVLTALGLLKRSDMAGWILFKLDGGLDHLLVDESQDTSPEQWELVDALVEDFFSGDSARKDEPRSLFVVGDEKQSIYRFQGAAPDLFALKRDDYRQRAIQSGRAFDMVPLQLSFRSTESVLQAVDAVFAQDHVKSGVVHSGDAVLHRAHRSGEAGRVELWSLQLGEKTESDSVWQVATQVAYQDSADRKLAERVASQIAQWLQEKEELESKNRPIRAGDILVLVQTRKAFVGHLSRALKQKGVPVAGLDRMKLREQIAVMDLLSLARFLLLPEDDLSLAEVLKSPIGNVSEEGLLKLAAGREKGERLFTRLRQSEDSPAKTLLLDALNKTDQIRPYELYAWLLESAGVKARFVARLGEEVLDPIDEFMALLLTFEAEHPPTLQSFLQWMESDDAEVKRDMEQGSDAVRIMTVHGAKGLQAPIVFLPDTTSVRAVKEGVIWQNGVPLLQGNAASRDPVTEAALAAFKEAEAEESRRLLYVAMTRAEDRLYICGWQDREQAKENCWYDWLVSGLKPIMQELGEGVWRMTCPQTKPHEVKLESQREADAIPPIPPALLLPPAAEKFPPQPLAPSRMEEEQVAAELPVANDTLSPVSDRARFRRGNVIHRLLQYLPDVPDAKREAAGLSHLKRFAADYPLAEQQAMLAEVLTVMRDPAIAPIFAEGSLAEVALTGLLPAELAGDFVLAAQVDRLLVREDGIWILDYKTGRHPPKDAAHVPAAYYHQMAIYRAALSAIYPGRPVHAALIWTAAPALMLLPEQGLTASLDSLRGKGLISKLS